MPDPERRTGKRQPLLDRRQALALGVGAFVVASIPLATRGRGRRVHRRVPLMGTIGEVAVVHRDERRAQAAIDAAFDALRDVEAKMSRFRVDSDVGRANRFAATAPVRVSADTAYVLQEALRIAEATAGRFDPCLGQAVALWDVQARRSPPASTRVRSYADRRLYRELDLEGDARGGAVRFRDADAAIDLGGIAKGHGVDAAVAALRAHGVENGLVNVGGDLYALGVSEDGDPWNVGVADPADPARITRTLRVTDGAVATSGDAERFFEHAGRRYHHLLDPRTGAPAEARARSVTVTASTCLAADAAATAVFGMEASAATGLLAHATSGARLVALDA